MPWFKVDDSLAFNAKFIALPLDAAGLWLRCGAWSAQQLTDGYVPRSVIASMGATKRQIYPLVSSGLWEEVANGFLFHDWNDYQPTSESVRAERGAAAERMRSFREKRKGVKKEEPAGQEPKDSECYAERTPNVRPNERRTNAERTPNERRSFGDPDPVPVPVPIPVPSQPSPTHIVGAPASRRSPTTPLPPDWAPTDEHRKFAAERGVDLDAEAFAFRQHAAANDRRQVRWNASFNQWLANATRWTASGRRSSGTASRTAQNLAFINSLPHTQGEIGA